jgi:hypothetical protein
MEVLKKQREELLLKKQAKERVLAELIPENVEVLKQQRELILAKKAEKERQLVELMSKQEIVSNRATGGTLSKSNSKKRGRSKRDEEDELVATTKQSTLSTSSSLFNTETKFILDDKQFDELRKEHKRNRKLIREQYQEFEVLTQYTLNRVDYLQQSLNLIMNHLGLVPAPTQPEPAKADDNIQKEDINIEIEVHNPSPAISSLTTQHTQIESVPTESLAVPIIEVIEAHTTDMIVESTPEIKTTDNLAHEQNHLEHQQEQQESAENNNNNNNNNNNSDNFNNNNNFNTNNSNNNNNNNNNNDTYNYNNNDNNMMGVVKERAHSESSGSDNNNNSNGQEDKYIDEENKKMMRFNNESKQENGIRNNCHNESFSATATTEYTNDQHHF